jgi:hypothetical protein
MRWREKLDDWHRIFCWQPYRIDGEWIWLEHIERRRKLETWVGDVFEYRLPPKPETGAK